MVLHHSILVLLHYMLGRKNLRHEIIVTLGCLFLKILTQNYFTQESISCHLSLVSCLHSPITCLLSPVSLLLSCLPSPISHGLPPITRLLSPISCSCLKPPVSHLLPHISASCLLSPVSHLLSTDTLLLSPVPRFMCNTSCLLYHVSCLTSPVSHLLYQV